MTITKYKTEEKTDFHNALNMQQIDVGQQYSQLHRLCSDFGLTVQCRPDHGPSTGGKTYCLTRPDKEQFNRACTPKFPSLKELDHFVSLNMVDILYGYLCS